MFHDVSIRSTAECGCGGATLCMSVSLCLRERYKHLGCAYCLVWQSEKLRASTERDGLVTSTEPDLKPRAGNRVDNRLVHETEEGANTPWHPRIPGRCLSSASKHIFFALQRCVCTKAISLNPDLSAYQRSSQLVGFLCPHILAPKAF